MKASELEPEFWELISDTKHAAELAAYYTAAVRAGATEAFRASVGNFVYDHVAEVFSRGGGPDSTQKLAERARFLDGTDTIYVENREAMDRFRQVRAEAVKMHRYCS